MSGYTVEVRTGILTEDNIIHSWLHITKPDGSKEAFGFYPADNIIVGPGVVKSENELAAYSLKSRPISITEEQYTELKSFIDSPPPYYSIPLGSQCTHWTLLALNKAGVIPSIITPNMSPDGLTIDVLETLIYNPLTQSAWFTIDNLFYNLLINMSDDTYPALPPNSIDTRLHHFLQPNINKWYLNADNRLQDPSKFNTYRIVWIGGDPLALDLDGDGLETVAPNGYSGALFDHNNNGIRTSTGWISGDDGLLVRDLNGNGIIDNGSELFGDSTQLLNGAMANNGFEALRDLDSNQDGISPAILPLPLPRQYPLTALQMSPQGL